MSLEDWKHVEQLQAVPGQGRQNPGPRIARDVVVGDGPDMMVPRKIRELEPELKSRRAGDPHPFVAGPARLNA